MYDDALRDRLLGATAEIVDRIGPQRIALRDVAHAAGTSTSAVYTLFGSKDELLTAVVESSFASFAAAQATAEPYGLRALGVAYREWALTHAARYRLMFGGGMTAYESRADPRVTVAAMEPLVRTLQACGVADPLTAALSVWAHVHGAVSLEVSCMAPAEVDWSDVYTVVLDGIERLWPAG